MGSHKNFFTISFYDFIFKLCNLNATPKVRAVLSGFPRSGTHWIRNVIELSSGLYCPSLIDLNVKRFKNSNDIPVIKIHARSKLHSRLRLFFNIPIHNFNNKFIYTYRDPRDSIISLYNMYNKIRNKSLSQLDFLKLYDPIGQFKWEINSWVINKNKSNVLVVRFEDLRLNPEKKFNEIFNFLELKVDIKKEYINQLVGQFEKKSRRKKGQVYGWKNIYSEYKTLINKINSDLKDEIKLLNYPNENNK